MSFPEIAGTALGVLLSPLFAMISAVLGRRVFHPTGLLTLGRVEALPEHAALAPLAARLVGSALVRWSGGAHTSASAPKDLLGCAVRFRRPGPLDQMVGADDQDLLTITSATVGGIFRASEETDVSEYRASTYHALGSFEDQDLGPLELRLVPRPPQRPATGSDRNERLRDAIARGDASMVLEVRGRVTGDAWQGAAEIVLEQVLEGDPVDLKFDPFRNGRGIRPAGFLHAVRRAVYPAAQRGRG
jgi:hypothetical protein